MPKDCPRVVDLSNGLSFSKKSRETLLIVRTYIFISSGTYIYTQKFEQKKETELETN